MNAVEAKAYGLVDEVLGDTADLQVLAKLSAGYKT
jgi:ATP-dependent protease ClpP protease subunit